MEKLRQRAGEIVKLLAENYPLETKCYLDYSGKAHELLVATILSAQCTDDRVNLVTKTLFQKYPSIGAFASADWAQLEKEIRPVGLSRTKARHIIESMKKLEDEHGGIMPSDIIELTAFPGVGRKTANVVRGHIFGIPSIVVDTHVKRISKKLGLSENDDPTKVEMDLMKYLPEDSWIAFNTRAIAFGRKICTAKNPKCETCFLGSYCVWNKDGKV